MDNTGRNAEGREIRSDPNRRFEAAIRGEATGTAKSRSFQPARCELWFPERVRTLKRPCCIRQYRYSVVKGVQLAIAEDAVSVDPLVSPEEAIHIAMARQ